MPRPLGRVCHVKTPSLRTSEPYSVTHAKTGVTEHDCTALSEAQCGVLEQCHTCKNWCHKTCTALSEAQYSVLETVSHKQKLVPQNMHRTVRDTIHCSKKKSHTCKNWCHKTCTALSETQYSVLEQCHTCKNWCHETCIALSKTQCSVLDQSVTHAKTGSHAYYNTNPYGKLLICLPTTFYEHIYKA